MTIEIRYRSYTEEWYPLDDASVYDGKIWAQLQRCIHATCTLVEEDSMLSFAKFWTVDAPTDGQAPRALPHAWNALEEKSETNWPSALIANTLMSWIHLRNVIAAQPYTLDGDKFNWGEPGTEADVPPARLVNDIIFSSLWNPFAAGFWVILTDWPPPKELRNMGQMRRAIEGIRAQLDKMTFVFSRPVLTFELENTGGTGYRTETTPGDRIRQEVDILSDNVYAVRVVRNDGFQGTRTWVYDPPLTPETRIGPDPMFFAEFMPTYELARPLSTFIADDGREYYNVVLTGDVIPVLVRGRGEQGTWHWAQGRYFYGDLTGLRDRVVNGNRELYTYFTTGFLEKFVNYPANNFIDYVGRILTDVIIKSKTGMGTQPGIPITDEATIPLNDESDILNSYGSTFTTHIIPSNNLSDGYIFSYYESRTYTITNFINGTHTATIRVSPLAGSSAVSYDRTITSVPFTVTAQVASYDSISFDHYPPQPFPYYQRVAEDMYLVPNLPGRLEYAPGTEHLGPAVGALTRQELSQLHPTIQNINPNTGLGTRHTSGQVNMSVRVTLLGVV